MHEVARDEGSHERDPMEVGAPRHQTSMGTQRPSSARHDVHGDRDEPGEHLHEALGQLAQARELLGAARATLAGLYAANPEWMDGLHVMICVSNAVEQLKQATRSGG